MKNLAPWTALGLFALGSALTAQRSPVRAEAPAPTSVWVDYDGDGRDDLVLVSPGGGARVLHHAGERGFVETTAQFGAGELAATRDVRWADADADGDLDLLTVQADGAVVLFANAGAAGFERVAAGALDSVAGARAAEWHDLEGDGLPDLLVHGARGPQLFRNDGALRFAAMPVEVSAAVPAPAVKPGRSKGSRTAVPTGSGPSLALQQALRCAATLKDWSTSTCLKADSTPTLGRLYPMSVDLNVDASGNVGIGTTTPTAKLTVDGTLLRRVARSTGASSDGIDVGQLASRTLTFEKTHAASAIRVTYSDNFRVLPVNSGGRWEIRVDGAAPPGGAVVFDYFNGGPNGVNQHRMGTLMGYCEGVPAGTHTIEIWVGPTPGYAGVDLFTGWNSQRWTLEAEEVF